MNLRARAVVGRSIDSRGLGAAALIVFSLLAGLLAGCSGDSDGDTAATTTQAGRRPLSGTITVSAAASLTDAFEAISERFTTMHPDVKVEFNFGSSGSLATQVEDGAPADVVAFANTTPMDRLADADLLAGAPSVFVRNRLVIVTKPGNPGRVTGLADLADLDVVALCVETAPCGEYANKALAGAGVEISDRNTHRGEDVRATLAAVSQGDADAGIVYETDATVAGDQVTTVEIPDDQNVIADYPIAVVRATRYGDIAREFVEFVMSDAGDIVLQKAGFILP